MSAGLQPEELFQAARERAATLDVGRGDAAVERVRAAASSLFARIPEPPVYRRAEDPTRKAAQALLPEVERVLAEALAAGRDPAALPALDKLVKALLAHGEALCHTADGRLEAAEAAWRRAQELERAAHPTRHLVTAPPRPPPVFDKATGGSRYDPRPAPQATVKLVCPNTGCKRVNDFTFLTSHPYNRFVCPVCQTPFLGYFGELRALEVATHRSSKRYYFTVDEVGPAGTTRIEFEEASGQDFPAARRDLLAFLYTEARELKVVVNLTNQRLMWVSPASSCFVATVAFGEGAPELVAFRAYRDDVLRHSVLGRAFIRGYYRFGPDVAAWVSRRPAARRGARWVLRRVHGRLTTRSGRE